jgi:methyl-accepting chemotaxis protein
MGISTATAPAPAPRGSAITPDYSSASLHRRFLLTAALGGTIAILLLAGGAWRLLQRTIDTRADQTLAEAALRSDLVLASAIDARRRETGVLALSPQVVAAARQGTARAAALGLAGADIATAESRFAQTHTLAVAPDTRQMLTVLLPHLAAQQLILTDSSGYNAVVTHRSSDFVQSDESWWQDAWKNGYSISDAAYDSASRASVVSLASVVRDGDRKVGVVKVKFDVTPLVTSLASAGAGVRIDVLDAADRVILSSDSAAMGSLLRGIPAVALTESLRFRTGDVEERAVARASGTNRWRIVAHVPQGSVGAAYRLEKLGILGGAGALLAVLLGLLFAMNRLLTRRISSPLGELAGAAEAVAAGNFTVAVKHTTTDDEVGRLGRAVAAMVMELRRLAVEIASSTRETNTMSSEITAGSEEMAATAGEIASTASDLSVQASRMAETIGALAENAGSLRGLANELEAGAQEGVARNSTLRTLATENRSGLDASADSLGTLEDDVQASAAAIEALADASAEIRSFVTLVRKLARQSKLLALNAAMEAARAGAQGEGFAVVAGEVRRLATMSSDAAERTETIVNGVLSGIESSRASAVRAVEMATEVRSSTTRASASFAEIERAVAEAEAWTASVQQTSTTTSQLVADMTARLETLSGGTESFAAAMQQVAASSEEQSAATEEIAGAANTLVMAADRLSRLVAGLEFEESAAAAEPASPAARGGEVMGAGMPVLATA